MTLGWGLFVGLVAKFGSHALHESTHYEGISESNNIISWHESEDIKKIFPKFWLIPILHLQDMHYNMCFIAPQITVLNCRSVRKIFYFGQKF